jgi:hypothetical protein
MWLAVLTALMVLATGPASAGGRPSMAEWRYEQATADGPAEVVHLATNLRVWCDAKGRELVVAYRMEPGLIDPPQILLLPDGREWPMRVVASGLELEGRLPVSEAFAHDVERADVLEIWVPTEMGEALHTGRADPLRRIIRDCAAG